MGKKNNNRIKASQHKPENSRISTSIENQLSGEFSFSLKYLDDSKEKFNFKNKDCNYYCILLHRLQGLCKEEIRTLMRDPRKKKFYRLHSIDWNDKRVSEDCYSNLDEQLQSCEPWQFQLTTNEHGRVHGFFIGTTFYVVWLDPDHNLYS